MKPKVLCPKCGGEGEIEMSDELFATLNAVGKQSTVEQVAKKIGWSGHLTAINNRLEDLRKTLFLTRKRDGRRWVYSRNDATGKCEL